MITVDKQDTGDLYVVHSLEQPAVYLDHWALMDIACTENLANGLRTYLERKQGTLTISWLNLAEFSGVTDKATACKVEDFIDGILPRVFFLESDPFKVRKSPSGPDTQNWLLGVADNDIAIHDALSYCA